MSDELDDELTRMLQHHLDQDGKTKLEGVNPPGASEAAAGTWQGDAPEGSTEVPDLLSQPEVPAARPSSVPAQVSAAVTTGAPKRKSDLSQPLGYRAPAAPKDTELADLQADAKKRRGESQLGQAVTDFTERPTNFLDYAQRLGGGGVSAPPPKNPAWKDHEAEGERAIADLDARRASDARAGAAQSSAAKAAEKKDPQSETAKTYRSILTKLAPNIADQLEGASAEQMETMVPWLEKFAATHAAELKAQAAGVEAKRKEELHDKERAENLEHRKLTHQDSQAIAASNNAIAKASLGLRTDAAGRDAAKDVRDVEAAAAKKLEDIPPGYEVAPGSNPSADTRKKFHGLVSSAEKMKGLTAQMREALKGTDGWSRTFDPKTVTGLSQLAKMIQIEAKEVAGLGALSGPDMGLMEAMASDPTAIKTNLTVDLGKMLQQLDAWGDNSIAGDSKASGIRRVAAASAASPAGHGKVVFEGDGLREYEDGHIEEVK